MTLLLAVDNYMNLRMYPDHTIAVTSEQEGHEKHELYSGRRDAGSYHSPSATNTIHNITIAFNRPRSFNALIVDRNHNLAGITVTVTAYTDGGTVGETVFANAPPSAALPGNPADTYGVRTYEGAWLKRFPTYEATSVKISIATMGVGIRPQLPTIFLGPLFDTELQFRPVQDYRDILSVTEIEAEGGAMGRGLPGRRRQGTITHHFDDPNTFDFGILPLEYFADGRPMWIIHDADQAHRAVLAVRAVGEFDSPIQDVNSYRTTQLPWVECEPLVVST